jgi:hypothetical protein
MLQIVQFYVLQLRILVDHRIRKQLLGSPSRAVSGLRPGFFSCAQRCLGVISLRQNKLLFLIEI